MPAAGGGRLGAGLAALGLAAVIGAVAPASAPAAPAPAPAAPPAAAGEGWPTGIGPGGRLVSYTVVRVPPPRGPISYSYYLLDVARGRTVRLGGSAAEQTTDSLSTLSADGRYAASAMLAIYQAGPRQSRVGRYDVDRGVRAEGSLDPGGNPADSAAGQPALSADGRYLVFASAAHNLSPDGQGHGVLIYRHDFGTGRTVLVSVDSRGGPDAGGCSLPQVSADGRWVAFFSVAGTLVPGDTNGTVDLFVRDLRDGRTRRIAVGDPHGLSTRSLSISADGQRLVWVSAAADAVPGDTNGVADVFVTDLRGGGTRRVSVSTAGAQANGAAGAAVVSADGRAVAFGSVAGNLVPGGGHGVFVRDLVTGRTELVSAGVPAWPDHVAISADGRWVAFSSGGPDGWLLDRQTRLLLRLHVSQ